MGRRSPIRHGLGLVFRAPSVWLAELAWRWSLGIGASLLIFLCLLEFLDTLAVPQGNEFLGGRNHGQPVLRAVASLLQENGSAVLKLVSLLVPALLVLWVVAAALGRSATLKYLLSEPGVRVRSILGLNLLRAGSAILLLFGCLAVALLAGRASSAMRPPGSAFRLSILASCLALSVLLVCSWSINWLLTVAGIFAHSRRGPLAAIAKATKEICRHLGPFLTASFGFMLLRGVVLFVALCLAVFAIALAAISAWAAAVALVLVWLLYLAIADFLHLARLAAYVAIAQDSPTSGDQRIG